MTTRRGAAAAVAFGAVLPCRGARSQQRSVRLGWLLNTIPRTASFYVAFERRLRELGFVAGQNLLVDAAYAEGRLERFAPLARELVSRKPDVLFVSGPEAPLRALSEATQTIPIVVCAVDFDPEAGGFVKSLAHPGGNVTGVYVQQIEATVKRVELIHELMPSARRIALLTDDFTIDQLHAARRAVRSLGLELVVVQMRNYPYDYVPMLDEARAARSDAMVVLMSPRVFPNRESLVEAARKNRMPAVYGLTEYVDAGGLVAYGASLDSIFSRAAEYVARILGGEPPSTMPMEQAREFDLSINLKTANALGIKVPQSVLVRASKVIE
jgi:putative ABC transport system substrate-binding protein